MMKPLLAGLAAGGLGLAFVADSAAQNSPKSSPKNRPAAKSAVTPVQAADDEPSTGKLPRPTTKPLVVEDLSPELEKILKNWELTTSKFDKMTGEFTRFKYDKTFEVEWRASGRFAYEAPDRGNYELRGIEPGKDKDGRPERSQKPGSDGKTPYTLKADTAERWVCTGKEIIKINEKEKTYEKLSIPPDSQGENIMDGPLPFLFGMKAEKAKVRYQLVLKKNDKNEIRLDVLPRLQKDASNWTKATVILEPVSFKPVAVKLLDPTGAESVHVFKNIKVNPKEKFWEGDPFKPNLKPFKLVLNEKPSTVDLGENASPPAAARPAKTAGAGRTVPGSAPESASDTTGRKKPASNRN
jgi:TIGR03009 family protein